MEAFGGKSATLVSMGGQPETHIPGVMSCFLTPMAATSAAGFLPWSRSTAFTASAGDGPRRVSSTLCVPSGLAPSYISFSITRRMSASARRKVPLS